MAFDLSEITAYATLISENPNQKVELWSEAVRIDAREKNVLKPLIGQEESRKPFIEKRDLKAGGAQTVTFTTTAPVRMAGVMGGSELKSHTGVLEFGDFQVTVDMRRFAISHDQLLKYLRFNKTRTPEQLSTQFCKELWARMEQDDLQIVLRNAAWYQTNKENVFYIGGGTSVADLTPGDTLDTTTIEEAANQLEGQGCQPISTSEDEAGYEVPQYILFGSKKFLYPLENESKFREALLHAGDRGNKNPHWTGRMPMWKGNSILRHAVIEDTANGRQGSPLQPLARLGVAIPSGVATEVTGGGAYNPAGTHTDAVMYDYFSYFPGFYWKTYSAESAPTDTATYHAIIYNVSGADRGKYEIISYAAAGITANKLATVTRELDEVGFTQKTKLTSLARYSAVHPNGSLIIPCTRWGVPLGYALDLGAEAEFMAQGAIDADPIEHGDDFRSKRSGQWHVQASGIQGIRGYSPYQDTTNRYPNFLLVIGAATYPGLNLADLESTAT